MGSAAIPDLWPADIEQSEITPPVAILREQAAALGKKTGYLLEGRVDTSVTQGPAGARFVQMSREALGLTRAGNDPRLFLHRFLVVAPALDGYAYELFWIEHGADQYPARAPELDVKEGEPSELTLASEHDLLEYIRLVLNSEKTRRIVGSLLAQVKAMA